MTATLRAELHREQAALADRVTQEMLGVFGSLNFRAVDVSSPGFIEAAVSVAERGHREGAVLGQAAYSQMRAAEGVTSSYSMYSPQLDTGALRSALIVTGPLAAKKLMGRGVRIPDAAPRVFTATAGKASTAALEGMRESIAGTARRDQEAYGYLRVTRAGACDFCVTMSGNLYRSWWSATLTDGTRARRNPNARAAGEQYHDHCRCDTVAVFHGMPLPEGEYKNRREIDRALEALYAKGLTFREAMAALGIEVGF